MSTLRKLEVYRTSIPMRSFEHAAAGRDLSECILVRLELSDGVSGWGETLPREYVTGETLESVPADIESELLPILRDGQVERLRPDDYPTRSADGRCIQAAVAAVDLAWVDCMARAGLRVSDLLGVGTREGIPREIRTRITGVLGSSDAGKTAKRLRLMRLGRLRDFKLKLGLGEDVDRANLDLVAGKLRRSLRSGKCTLRVDVNGAWDADSTPDRVEELASLGVIAVEQPVFCGAAELAELAGRCSLPLLADESLLTAEDAELLAERPGHVWWNVRISKNGGPRRANDLLNLAAERGVTVSNGCMVGETSLLSAAQRHLLVGHPEVRFAEGNYGRWLLSEDVTDRSLRFGLGGRLKLPRGDGLGVTVDDERLSRLGRRVVSFAV
ncbi:MAG: mandelate racemase/muconate lactonizing enzyme family protein [Phycisphaerae bacterium]